MCVTDVMLGYAVQGWDTLVRGTKISKGRFVQGAQHPRTFGREHIGRGHINPASRRVKRRADYRTDRRADYRVERVADCRTNTRAACRLERRAD
jgi:hypothetical protein